MTRVAIYSWKANSLLPGKTRAWPKRTAWRHGNFGDLFNQDLAQYLFGSDAINIPYGVVPRFLFVGSTIHFAGRRDIIAGAGLRSADSKINVDPQRILGLRGRLSSQRLVERFGRLPNLRFFGDPGLLASRVFSDLAKPRKQKTDLLLIPHYQDLSTWEMVSSKDFELISPDNKPHTVFSKILESKAVITSSLHGLIFSQSAGVPAVLVPPKSQPDFKYRDYESTLSIPITRYESLHEAIKGSEISTPEVPISELEELDMALKDISRRVVRHGMKGWNYG